MKVRAPARGETSALLAFCRNKWLRASLQLCCPVRNVSWGRVVVFLQGRAGNLAAAGMTGHCAGSWGLLHPMPGPEWEPVAGDHHPSCGMQAGTDIIHGILGVSMTNSSQFRLLKQSHPSQWSRACSVKSALLNIPVCDFPRLAQQINNVWSCLHVEANTSCS